MQATGLDQLVGLGMVALAGLVFSYYTIWVLILVSQVVKERGLLLMEDCLLQVIWYTTACRSLSLGPARPNSCKEHSD